ncbi:MAG TPA: hypothetical protein PKD00_00025 [Burkholderiales bacterium]|nr:hypothetical protein [Burkholderiales bacterium]
MAIIAISGKMGSEKNLVASIIQYLTSNEYQRIQDKYSWSSFVVDSVNVKLHQDAYSVWQQKSFAGKLKQIVSILTGIPVKDLEKEEIKNRVLGDEWEVSYVNGYNPSKPNGMRNLTVKEILQKIDTKAMRDVIHPNVWCNALFVEYIKGSQCNCVIHEESNGCYHCDDTGWDIPPSKWIITDMKYLNELDAVKTRDGITIRINRDNIYEEYCKFVDSDKATFDDLNSNQDKMSFELFNRQNDEFKKRFIKEEHYLKTASDNATFDYTIENNSGIPELIEQIKQILIKEKII